MSELAAGIIAEWETMKSARATTEWHWQECADYLMPDRADFTLHRAPGQKRMQKVYDSTPIWAANQCAAGFHSMLTNPFLQWMGLRAQDDRVDEIDRVRAWLEDTSKRMHGLFSGASHNFATGSHELYLDLAVIGIATMAVLESQRVGVLFSNRHMGECVISENDEDRVDKLTRCWEYTAKQAVQAWGNAAGERAVKLFGTKPETRLKFLHAVRPRIERNPDRRDARHMPFESVYVALDDKAEIKVSGFDSFPYLVPRLSKAPGEVYGRGIGMQALPDVKQLNLMEKTLAQQAQLAVQPPTQYPDDGYISRPDLTPGARNPYRAGSRDRIETIRIEGQVQFGAEMAKAKRTQIIRDFYVDWLLMPSDPSDPSGDGKGITATYVLHRRDQQMQLLSPMVARLQTEFLGPLIDRTLALMFKQSIARGFGPGSMLAPPPPELSGAGYKVEYLSPMAVAQRGSALDGIARLVQTATMLQPIDPTVAQVLDGEAILRLTGRDLNTPMAALRTAEQVAAQRQAEAEAQAQMNAHAQLSNVASAAADGAGAIKDLAQAGGAGQPQQVAA